MILFNPLLTEQLKLALACLDAWGFASRRPCRGWSRRSTPGRWLGGDWRHWMLPTLRDLLSARGSA